MSRVAVPVALKDLRSSDADDRVPPHLGQFDEYLDVVVATCSMRGDTCDVIVLAHASMAAAAHRANSTIAVLSSPRLAVEDAVGRVRADTD